MNWHRKRNRDSVRGIIEPEKYEAEETNRKEEKGELRKRRNKKAGNNDGDISKSKGAVL